MSFNGGFGNIELVGKSACWIHLRNIRSAQYCAKLVRELSSSGTGFVHRYVAPPDFLAGADDGQRVNTLAVEYFVECFRLLPGRDLYKATAARR